MPSYKTNDPRGWCGDPRRGAAMGRVAIENGPLEGKMTLRRVRLCSGGYDSNGTYFGIGQPLYWYADKGGNVDAVIRASNREAAKAIVIGRYPTAKFYR